MNFLSAIRLAQSILKRKSPSVYKSLQKISLSKRAFKKYKPRGLFSEFYGMLCSSFMDEITETHQWQVLFNFYITDVPQQLNSTDCGVFVCMVGLAISTPLQWTLLNGKSFIMQFHQNKYELLRIIYQNNFHTSLQYLSRGIMPNCKQVLKQGHPKSIFGKYLFRRRFEI